MAQLQHASQWAERVLPLWASSSHGTRPQRGRRELSLGILRFFSANAADISVAAQAGAFAGAAPALGFFSHPSHPQPLQSRFRSIFAVSVSERVGFLVFFLHACVLLPALGSGPQKGVPGASATSPAPSPGSSSGGSHSILALSPTQQPQFLKLFARPKSQWCNAGPRWLFASPGESGATSALR